MEDADEVFEDALEDVEVEEAEEAETINNLKQKKNSKFKFKRSKSKKKDSEVDDEISLEQGLEEGQQAIDLFFENRFAESRELAQKHCDRSIYHALGHGTFHYLRAVMTFDQDHIKNASTVLSESVATIDKYRKKSGGLVDTLGKMVRKQDYDSYTEMEIHAELVYAECLLLKAMLTVCEDETLVSFVQAGLKVRQCYLSFRTCWEILECRSWNVTDDRFKSHFEGGVQLGVGTFNLVMSLLPPRITKLLQFIGFTGSRSVGMSQLMKCYENESCIRHFLASIILLGYNLFVTHHTGQGSSSDLKLVSEILNQKLAKYPDGAFFLFFQGRFLFVQGKCREAIGWYTRANEAQSEWPQFHHVACWEMMWAASYECQWREALVQSSRLLQESRWSPCLYSYLKVAHYCMLQSSLSDAEMQEMKELVAAIPGLKQRIAGKSLPMEKFAIKKAERWNAQDGRLTLPGLELVYLWNGFSIMGLEYSRVEQYYVVVEQELDSLKHVSETKYHLDNECLILLLKGMCLKYMSAPLAAEECFRNVIEKASKENLQADKYLLPYATVELALLLIETSGTAADEAWSLLETAKTFKDYTLQSRLHFRIHAAQNKMKSGDEGNNNFLKDDDLLMNFKEDKGNILRDLENCSSESQLREMVPHI